jgi:hypothetical protein
MVSFKKHLRKEAMFIENILAPNPHTDLNDNQMKVLLDRLNPNIKVIIVGTDTQISNHTMEKYNGSLDLFMENYTKRNELKEHILKVSDQTCSWFEFLRDVYVITGDDIDSVDTTQGQLYYLLSEALNEVSIDDLKKLI